MRVVAETPVGEKNSVLVNEPRQKHEAYIESEGGVRVVVTRIELDVNVKLNMNALTVLSGSTSLSPREYYARNS